MTYNQHTVDDLTAISLELAPAYPQKAPQGTEYAARELLEPGIVRYPEAVLASMMEFSEVIRPEATHPDKYNVSEVSLVRGINGLYYMVGGTNWNPESGTDDRRTCGFSVMLRGALEPYDQLSATNLVNAPPSLRKPIVGSIPQRTIAICGFPCRGILTNLDRDTVIGGRIDDSEIQEAYFIGDSINYHEKGGPYVMHSDGLTLGARISPSKLFLNAVAWNLELLKNNRRKPIVDPASLAVVKIDPSIKTQGYFEDHELAHLL